MNPPRVNDHVRVVHDKSHYCNACFDTCWGFVKEIKHLTLTTGQKLTLYRVLVEDRSPWDVWHGGFWWYQASELIPAGW